MSPPFAGEPVADPVMRHAHEVMRGSVDMVCVVECGACQFCVWYLLPSNGGGCQITRYLPVAHLCQHNGHLAQRVLYEDNQEIIIFL